MELKVLFREVYTIKVVLLFFFFFDIMYRRIWGEQMMGQFSSMRGNLVNLFKSMIIDWVLFEIYCDIFVFSLLLLLFTNKGTEVQLFFVYWEKHHCLPLSPSQP